MGKGDGALDTTWADRLFRKTDHAQHGLGSESVHLMIIGHSGVMTETAGHKKAATSGFELAVTCIMLTAEERRL